MSKLEIESIEECSKFLEGETFIYNDFECVVLSGAEECYVLGYKKAIDKACEWLYDYNQQQAKRGARAVLSIKDFTIDVEDFKKAMEE